MLQKWLNILPLLLFVLLLPHGSIAYAEGQNGLVVNGDDSVYEGIKKGEENKQQDNNDGSAKTEDEQKQPSDLRQQEELPEEAPPTFENTFSWLDLVKLFFALFFVIALIYLILRLLNQKNKVFGNIRAMENLGGISLGNNRSVQLVKVGERILVIGVGETITLIKEIETQEEAEAIISAQQKQPLQTGTDLFSQIFQKRLNKGDQVGQKAQFKSQLQEQLDEMKKGRKKVYDSIKDEDSDE